MSISLNVVIKIFYFFTILDIILIFGIIFNKIKIKKTLERDKIISREIISNYRTGNKSTEKIKWKEFFRTYTKLSQVFEGDSKMNNGLVQRLIEDKAEKYYLRRLNSLLKYRRIEAAAYLANFNTKETKEALEKSLSKEKNYLVKFYIVNALVNIKNKSSISIIINTLLDSPQWYLNKTSQLLYEFGKDFYEFIPEIIDSKKNEITELIIGFSNIFIAEDLKNYLMKIVDSKNRNHKKKALDVLAKLYYIELDKKRFLESSDIDEKIATIKAVSMVNKKENLIKIINYLNDKESSEYAIYAISTMMRKNPNFLIFLIDQFNNKQDKKIKNSFVKILSNRIEYFLVKILSDDSGEIKSLIEEILNLGITSEIIGFLNKNRDIEIENEILNVIKPVLKNNEKVSKEFATYVNDRILKKVKILRYKEDKKRKEAEKEKNKIIFLYIILISVIALFPTLYLIRRQELLSTTPIIEQFKIYIVDFNYYLVYYSTSINLIYLLILILSFVGVYFQKKQWQLKNVAFLFKKNILPSISIIAPAYCEEATILESTNSLLNLRYPNYELIVVNDGSSDNTLNTLIDYFKLEKVDVLIDYKLKTKPIQGLYINKSIPNFIVVDKANGGKADSLNAGINVSRKDFFCGIDADSLLEPDALLKVASLILDTESESVAVGGNIFPINGCSVDKGLLTNIELPKNRLAKLQTMEYIRAFMAGRVGWAFTNCLLIISGAFGLFNKKRVIEMGGYLTSSGKYKKDTVGEDMELVVRLSALMRDKKEKYAIHYSFNANCWTEVPEEINVLQKQRDRWQRGLIDIISFHRNILFNRKYGSMGLVSMPYFFIFEMIGPLIEIQGYLMVVFAAIFGLINLKIAMLLFLSTIMMGILISLSSLYIAEKEINYFSFKDIMVLLVYAVVENFGIRQIISFWRVLGFFNAMKKPKGWGKMVRKGFVKKD